jgi:hypothetical protein
MNLTQVKRTLELASLSGIKKEFLYNFQSLSALELSAYRPDIIRIANDPEVNTVEPLGDKTSIPKKWDRWSPNRMENTWEDKSPDTPEPPLPAAEPLDSPAVPGHNIAREEFDPELMTKEGYKKDCHGHYTKILEQDITTLATYGYYTVKEACCLCPEDLKNPTVMQVCYNFFGHYIGSPEDAKFLCQDKGIVPELSCPTNKVCSIGKSTKDQLWYGWSHRAITGFCEGSTVEPGDCAYTPATLDDAVSGLFEWHDNSQDPDSNPKNVLKVVPVGENDSCFQVKVYHECYHNLTVKNPSSKPCYITDEVKEVPKGKGYWIAQSEEDAKQMAKDFAASVSTSTVSIEDNLLTSISASKNPLDYSWYSYTNDRVKKYTKHHKSVDLELEKGEKFGIRYSSRTKQVYLVESTSLGTEFKLSEREALSLIKVAKPFRGQIEGIRVSKGTGDIKQVQVKSNRVRSHTNKEETIEKPLVQKKPARKNVTYFGFFIPNIKLEKWAFVEETSIALVKSQLDKFMSNNKHLGSAASIVLAEGQQAKDLSLKLGNRAVAYLSGSVYNSVIKKLKVVKKDYLPEGVFLYDETVKVPSHDESSFKLKEEVFYGNEILVLEELQDAIIKDKKFTGIFSGDTDRLSRSVRVRSTSKGLPFIMFNTRIVNKQYINEAQMFIRRVKGMLGDAIQGTVSVLKTESITVTLFLSLKKTSSAQQARSKLLDTFQKNSVTRVINQKRIASLLEERKRLSIGERTGAEADTAKRGLRNINKELEKISNSLVTDQVIAFNAPMYTVKKGQTFVPVEVTGIDISRGTIETRLVRGRKLEPNSSVTEVYSLDGSKRLI